ncbi:MAG: hypothetical protein ACSNEK_04585 [Parachlamydiaceae bacterium]
MIIKCISKEAKDLARDLGRESYYGYESRLAIGEAYLVHAMLKLNGWGGYFIENGCHYPKWHPAGLFEVVDPKISQYWIFHHQPGLSRRETQ